MLAIDKNFFFGLFAIAVTVNWESMSPMLMSNGICIIIGKRRRRSLWSVISRKQAFTRSHNSLYRFSSTFVRLIRLLVIGLVETQETPFFASPSFHSLKIQLKQKNQIQILKSRISFGSIRWQMMFSMRAKPSINMCNASNHTSSP